MKNVTPKVEEPATSEEIIKRIDELNEKSSSPHGHWIHDERLGTVWQPTGDLMGQLPAVPEPATPPPLLESIVQWGKMYDFDNLPKNAVVIIKLNVKDPLRVQMMQRAIANQVLQPRAEKLKANQVCVLFMESTDDISVMSEEDMKKAGWEKKDKQRIITLS